MSARAELLKWTAHGLAMADILGQHPDPQAEATRLVDAALTEALTSPRHHEHVMALLRRESRIRRKPPHELNGWS